MFLMIVSLLVSSALAQDTVAEVTTEIRLPAATNRSGLFGKNPAMTVGYDEHGCPTVSTFGPQFIDAKDVATMVGAATDARTRCIQARAAKTASDRQAEANYGATIMLASANADVLRAAVASGEPTFSVIDAKGRYTTATGIAAPLAAADGSFGGGAIGGISPWVTQGARDLLALQAINGRGNNPPVTAPKNTAPRSSSSSSPPSSPQTAVRDVEDEARSAAARAAGVTPR